MKTEAHVYRDGIARLLHAEAPLVGIYGRDRLWILVERGGRVVLQTHFTANNPAESVV